RIRDWVGQVHPVGVGALGPTALNPDGMAGIADHGRVGRHVVDHDAVRADLRTVADRDRPKELGAGTDRHVVLDRRMALAGRQAGRISAPATPRAAGSRLLAAAMSRRISVRTDTTSTG